MRAGLLLRVLASLLLAAVTMATTPAMAHKPSDSYLTIETTAQGISGRWDIALRDLDFAIGLDADGNGEITWGELRAAHAAIAAYALARLTIAGDDGAACPLQGGEQQVDNHTDGAYTVLRFAVRCSAPTPTLRIGYRLFSDIDPQHRGLLRLSSAGLTQTAIFSPQAASQTFRLKGASRLGQFADYAVEGIWHIWRGYDHILFLLSLLLPAVLVWPRPQHGRRRGPGGWRPVGSLRAAVVDVLKIVTSFTLAHSITLSLATLGFVSLPSRLVESTIAASVVLAALNNVWPVFHGRRWIVAFVFGLVHGFGFASVLVDLGLPRDALALALVGFNLGVECGQLAIVAAFLPAAYLLRRTRFYQRVVLAGGSLVIAVVAAVWLAERVANFKVLPF